MDAAHKETDKLIAEMEKKLQREYTIAAKELKQKADKYMSDFAVKDAQWQDMLAEGTVTQTEYNNWRMGQIMTGKRWNTLQNQIAEDMVNANNIAHTMVYGYQGDVYALNLNFATYEVEQTGRIDTNFTLYDGDTVQRLMKDDPDMLPPPGKTVQQEIADGKALLWNKQQVQSVMTQGILQGESIDQLATRLAETVTTRNYNAAVRYARTMTTNTQNAGRYAGYRRAKALGVDLTIEWSATLDNRTRHTHRQLDGQRREVDEPFNVDGVEILYPAQLAGEGSSDIPQSMIWNCRCTLLAWVKGYEADKVTSSPKMGDMTYDEWKDAKNPAKRTPPQVQQSRNVASQATSQSSKSGTVIRDYNSQMAQMVGQDRYDELCDYIDNCENQDVRQMYATEINNVKIGSINAVGTEHHSGGYVYYNAAKDDVERLEYPKHSVFFHESGHAMDYLNRDGNEYLSQWWNNGEFGDTLRKEVSDFVDTRYKFLKEGYNTHVSDASWLRENGFLTKRGEEVLTEYASKNGHNLADILSGKVYVDDWYARYLLPEKPTKKTAYESIARELNEMCSATTDGNWRSSSVSDIFSGATRRKIDTMWGHAKKYWDDESKLPKEAFAEFSEAYMAGAESLETIKKYLPKSLDCYDRMIHDLVGGQ